MGKLLILKTAFLVCALPKQQFEENSFYLNFYTESYFFKGIFLNLFLSFCDVKVSVPAHIGTQVKH